jgi:putative glycosyltransferase (TIGR04372 family)
VVEQALETDNLKIIDYAANYRSDFLDIFLSANCEFFIGSTGGFTALPRIFRRPMAQVNFAPLGWNALLTCTPSNLVIPKKLWLRSESRYMIFPEIIGSGADEFATTRQFEELGIDVIENSPGEIADLAIELDERVRGVWQSRGEDEELQRRFWSLFKPDGASISFLPRIGAAFLREHRDLVA